MLHWALVDEQDPAELFGVGDSLGTIEEGKTANLMVTNGNPLEIRMEVRYLFINGNLVSLENLENIELLGAAKELIEIAGAEEDQGLKRQAIERISHIESKEARDFLAEFLKK